MCLALTKPKLGLGPGHACAALTEVTAGRSRSWGSCDRSWVAVMARGASWKHHGAAKTALLGALGISQRPQDPQVSGVGEQAHSTPPGLFRGNKMA